MQGGASVERFELVLQGLSTPVGLQISALRVFGSEAAIQPDPFSYSLPEPAKFEALILEPTLEAFVRTKLPDNFENANLKLEPGRIVVRATVRVILPVAATAVCSLRVEEEKRLFVQLDSVEMLGAGVKGLVQKQIDAINPILDAAEWPLDLRIAEVRIEQERIVATGWVSPP
jgi:hypothetical protein